MNITPEVERISKEAEATLATVETYPAILNQTGYEQAAVTVKDIKAKAKELDTLRKSMTKPLDESKKTIMDFFRKPATFLEDAEKKIKLRMSDFVKEEQRKERNRLEAIALEEAQQQEALGNEEEAEAIIVAVQTVEPEKPKADGIKTRKTYKARVVDKKELIRAVAEGKAFHGLLTVDMGLLNSMARNEKEELSIPGVVVDVDTIIIA